MYLIAWVSVHISASVVCMPRSYLQTHPLDLTVNFSSRTPFVKNRADLQFFTQEYLTKNTHSLNLKFLQKCVLLRRDSCSRWEREGRKSSPNELPMKGATPLTSIFLAGSIKRILILIYNRDEFQNLILFAQNRVLAYWLGYYRSAVLIFRKKKWFFQR